MFWTIWMSSTKCITCWISSDSLIIYCHIWIFRNNLIYYTANQKISYLEILLVGLKKRVFMIFLTDNWTVYFITLSINFQKLLLLISTTLLENVKNVQKNVNSKTVHLRYVVHWTNYPLNLAANSNIQKICGVPFKISKLSSSFGIIGSDINIQIF